MPTAGRPVKQLSPSDGVPLQRWMFFSVHHRDCDKEGLTRRPSAVRMLVAAAAPHKTVRLRDSKHFPAGDRGALCR
jgi:hypothetical protein